ncbi:hypothetical protein CAEBREN_01856 [Caenorhabditis brenneri]|uniref:Homeobox domain-containing protein n=1 Tax=Caenorhabditis brenneri TaxID=135651 RepID=G0NYS5_CAEBE|nr:hypothetical protein CAEBREN_01856 [Caenorhabditis brenneri]
MATSSEEARNSNKGKDGKVVRKRMKKGDEEEGGWLPKDPHTMPNWFHAKTFKMDEWTSKTMATSSGQAQKSSKGRDEGVVQKKVKKDDEEEEEWFSKAIQKKKIMDALTTHENPTEKERQEIAEKLHMDPFYVKYYFDSKDEILEVEKKHAELEAKKAHLAQKKAAKLEAKKQRRHKVEGTSNDGRRAEAAGEEKWDEDNVEVNREEM